MSDPELRTQELSVSGKRVLLVGYRHSHPGSNAIEASTMRAIRMLVARNGLTADNSVVLLEGTSRLIKFMNGDPVMHVFASHVWKNRVHVLENRAIMPRVRNVIHRMANSKLESRAAVERQFARFARGNYRSLVQAAVIREVCAAASTPPTVVVFQGQNHTPLTTRLLSDQRYYDRYLAHVRALAKTAHQKLERKVKQMKKWRGVAAKHKRSKK